jgi:inosose dehydratase
MATAGFDATEAGPIGYLGTDPDEIAARLARHGLGLVGGFVPLVLHDSERRSESLATAEGVAALFDAAGASLFVTAVVLDDDWSPPHPLSGGEWRSVLDGLARVDEIALQHGLTHVLHPHWGTLVERREDVERVLEESEVLMCLDTGHLVLGGTDPVWLAAAAGERIAHVHLKDVATVVAERLRSNELTLVEAVRSGLFRPLGEGDVSVGDTVRALGEHRYDGWYVLEQDRALASAEGAESDRSLDDMRRSIDYLQSLAAAPAAHAVEGR